MNENNPFSFTKGYSFLFEDEGIKIKAWFSSFSGLEKIYVNKELILTQRKYSKDSISKFNISNNNYSVSLKVESFVKGPFICTLNKNGIAIKRQSLQFPRKRDNKKKVAYIFELSVYITIGAILGVINSNINLPTPYIVITLIIAFMVSFVCKYKIAKNNYLEPLIQDEEIE